MKENLLLLKNWLEPFDYKSNAYIDFNKENNKQGPKFKVHDHVRISKYKNIFAKGCFCD